MNLDLDTDEHKPLFKMMTTEETDQAKADVEAQVMLLVKKLKRNKLIKVPFILNAAEYKISVYDDDKIEAVMSNLELVRVVRKIIALVFIDYTYP